MAGETTITQEAHDEVLPEGEGSQILQGREPAWVMPTVLLAIALFLFLVRRILTPFIIAAVLAYIFSPVVSWLEKRARIRRAFAALLFLLLALGPVVALGWALEPTLVRETRELATNAPNLSRNLLVQLFGGESVNVFGQTVDANWVTRYLQRALGDGFGTPAGAIHLAASVAEAMLDTFLSLVLLFYFLLNPRPFSQAAFRLLPFEYRALWRRVGWEIHLVLGRYVRGVLFLIFLMASVTWIGLALIFHLPYALPIALATGFLEIIPFVGPVVAAAIAATVALSVGGINLALAIALFYLVLRQLEDQLVMPLVIGRAVELHPVVAIFAVLSGGALAGVLGALLAIPVAAALKVAFDNWRPA